MTECVWYIRRHPRLRGSVGSAANVSRPAARVFHGRSPMHGSTLTALGDVAVDVRRVGVAGAVAAYRGDGNAREHSQAAVIRPRRHQARPAPAGSAKPASSERRICVRDSVCKSRNPDQKPTNGETAMHLAAAITADLPPAAVSLSPGGASETAVAATAGFHAFR